MARTSSIYDQFDLYLTPVTLTFNLPSNGTFPSRGQQLCKIIFIIHAQMYMYKLWPGQAQYMTILTFI